MKKIVLASNNTHKIQEIKQMIPEIKILTLSNIGFIEEIAETAPSFRGNAYLKAAAAFNKSQIPALGDDSGLEVEVLKGNPGVLSKRYAGTGKAEDNIQKLLQALAFEENRTAQFRTVLCYLDGKKAVFFEGIIKGKIIHKERGGSGFGYDPVFVPKGYSKTFAEMSVALKNTISHRALALQKWVAYMKDHTIP